MVRRKTTLRSKSGGFGAQNGNGNGNPRAVVDETVYRESLNANNWRSSNTAGRLTFVPFWDPQYSGLSNPSRPRDYAIFLRPIHAISTPG
jgi:hypothetical protein